MLFSIYAVVKGMVWAHLLGPELPAGYQQKQHSNKASHSPCLIFFFFYFYFLIWNKSQCYCHHSALLELFSMAPVLLSKSWTFGCRSNWVWGQFSNQQSWCQIAMCRIRNKTFQCELLQRQSSDMLLSSDWDRQKDGMGFPRANGSLDKEEWFCGSFYSKTLNEMYAENTSSSESNWFQFIVNPTNLFLYKPQHRCHQNTEQLLCHWDIC